MFSPLQAYFLPIHKNEEVLVLGKLPYMCVADEYLGLTRACLMELNFFSLPSKTRTKFIGIVITPIFSKEL
jgi:hypothetical protein